MIVKMLNYLNEGNDFSNRAMQKNLKLSEFMVETYKKQLEENEFIKKAEDSECQTSCKSCTASCAFAGGMDNQLIMWEITEKGHKVLAKAKERT